MVVLSNIFGIITIYDWKSYWSTSSKGRQRDLNTLSWKMNICLSISMSMSSKVSTSELRIPWFIISFSKIRIATLRNASFVDKPCVWLKLCYPMLPLNLKVHIMKYLYQSWCGNFRGMSFPFRWWRIQWNLCQEDLQHEQQRPAGAESVWYSKSEASSENSNGWIDHVDTYIYIYIHFIWINFLVALRILWFSN